MNTLDINSALLQLVETRYEQIIHVNLSHNECDVIWSIEDEPVFHVDSLLNTGKLFLSDIKALKKLHDINYIRQHLSKKKSLSYKYREKKKSRSFEWKQIEVIKSSFYSDDNIDVLFFIKSIQDGYGKEYKAKQAAEHEAKTDNLTRFYNRSAFDKFKSDLMLTSSIGVVYIDVNCLKDVNDTSGHSAGDNYIKSCCQKISDAFARCNKFRIGGDEFVVVAIDFSLTKFKLQVNKFLDSIHQDVSAMPMCSIGYRWTDSSNVNIDEIVIDAERDMYANKEADYLKYNHDRRTHSDRRICADRRHHVDRLNYA